MFLCSTSHCVLDYADYADKKTKTVKTECNIKEARFLLLPRCGDAIA